jgi:parallel beta-helix repeat protein
VLKNNVISGTGVGFEVSGSPQPSSSSFINDIDDSNIINDKKIYYLVDKSDLSINPSTYPNIGYLALINCTRITVENTQLYNQGLLLAWTTESQIKNNDISNNYGNGVTLTLASNIKITNNKINSNSGTGITFTGSNQNIVSGNYITRNQNGISLFSSSGNNTITQNNIADQDTGVYFHVSSSNLIYSNNFVNNTRQVYDVSWGAPDQNFPGVPSPSKNIWDNDYPIGGNYWSNYANQYPEAKELDNSGIWDTPHFIDENNQDGYPLLNPLDIAQVQGYSPVPEDDSEQKEETVFLSFVASATVVVVAAAVGAGLLVYFKKRNHMAKVVT